MIRNSGTMMSWLMVSGVAVLGFLWVGAAQAAAALADRGLVDGGSAHRHLNYLEGEDKSGRDSSRDSSQTEACCFRDGRCENLLPSSCTDAGGHPLGAGSTCRMVNCGSPPPEACCFENGRCESLEPSDCEDAGGQPQGPGTTCRTADCGPPPDCEERCHAEADQVFEECIDEGIDEGRCRVLADEFLGMCILACLPPPPTEACCFEDGRCEDLMPIACTGAGGQPQGADTTCRTVDCGSPPTDCEHRCRQEGERAFRECMEAGGNEDDCAAEARAFVEECLRENCPPPPPDCARRCHKKGGHIFRACMRGGGSEDDCAAEAREFVDECLREECPEPPACGRRCREGVERVFDECIEDGGTERECKVLSKEHFKDCVRNCPG